MGIQRFSILLVAFTILLFLSSPLAAQLQAEHFGVELPPVNLPAAHTPEGVLELAIIVSVERSDHLSGLPGAALTAQDWQTFFSKSRGIKDERILLLQNQQVTPTRLRQELPRHLE